MDTGLPLTYRLSSNFPAISHAPTTRRAATRATATVRTTGFSSMAVSAAQRCKRILWHTAVIAREAVVDAVLAADPHLPSRVRRGRVRLGRRPGKGGEEGGSHESPGDFLQQFSAGIGRSEASTEFVKTGPVHRFLPRVFFWGDCSANSVVMYSTPRR